MKTRFVAMIALGATTLSPMLAAPGFAATTEVPVAAGASAETLALMQTQCNALAAAHTPTTGTYNGIADNGAAYTTTWHSVWTAVAVEGVGTLVSGPTEFGARTIDPDSIVGTGSFTWGGVKIVGDPFRNGGSVNMFGNQRATEKNFASSEYDYTADFKSTFSYASTCEMTETVTYDAVHIPGHKVLGYYSNPGGGDCGGFDPSKHFWGEDQGACLFTQTGPAQDPIDVDAREDVNYSTEIGAPISQEQVDNFLGHEVNGGPVTLSGDLFVGNPVVCISPKKLPGAWTKQNGYTGDKCTTAYFNVAPWGNGSTTSQGTYISVPAY